jgi:hypothetical protein
MDLETLLRRLEHERYTEKDDKEIKIITRGGNRFNILSVNWDDKAGEWVIIGE